jgi:hypothetical protein
MASGTAAPRNGGCVHFLETLHALAGRVAGAELPLSEEFRIHDRLVKRLPRDTAPAKYMVREGGREGGDSCPLS